MSGTSLDGIDTALVDIQGHGMTTIVQLIDFLTLPFQMSQLVPYVDWLLYRNETSLRFVHNIGGIGNVTVLPM